MKKLSLYLSFLVSINVTAQSIISDYITGLYHPESIAFHGDTLYVSQQDGKIFRFKDLNDTSSKELVTSVLSLPIGMVFKGDSMFVSDGPGGVVMARVSQPMPIINFDTVVLCYSTGLILSQNDLYYSNVNSGSGTYRLNVTSSPLTPTLINNTVFGAGHVIKNDTLYLIGKALAGISLINLSAPNFTEIIVTGLNQPVGMALAHNSILYYAEYAINRLSYVDIDNRAYDTTIVFEDTGFYPTTLAVHDTCLYIDEWTPGKISKLCWNSYTGINSQHIKSILNIYPNPTSDEITINLDQAEREVDVKIYDVNSKLVFSSHYGDLQSENIRLPESRGIYYVQVTIKGETYARKVLKL